MQMDCEEHISFDPQLSYVHGAPSGESGTHRPSRANEAAFDAAVEAVTAAADRLIASLVTTAPPRNREEEARKARERSLQRFA